MRTAPITGTALVALLALTSCGGNNDTTETQEPDTETSVAEETTTEDTAPQDAEPATDDMAAEDPGEPNDIIDQSTQSIGDTFYLASMDGMGAAEVTYEGFEWVDPARVAGEENYGFAIFSVAAEGDMPVQLPAPIDGGGWHYVTADGEMQSLYTLTEGWSGSWTGRVSNMYSGPFTPGVSESNLLEEVVVPERGGELVHIDGTGMIEVTLELPDESVNGDNPAIDEVYQIADADWDGEVSSP